MLIIRIAIIYILITQYYIVNNQPVPQWNNYIFFAIVTWSVYNLIVHLTNDSSSVDDFKTIKDIVKKGIKTMQNMYQK